MNRKLMYGMFVVASLCGLHGARADLVWDATSQFSATSNEATDTWQYMSGGKSWISSNFLLPTYGYRSGSSFDCWYDSNDAYALPLVGKTDDGVLAVHPGNSSYPITVAAILAWKAPDDFTAGKVNVQFQLTSLDVAEGTDGVDYYFFNNAGTSLTSGTLPASTDPSNLSTTGLITLNDVQVQAGEKLYLHVGPNNQLAADLTGVTFQVTAVPEPTLMSLCGMGAISLLAYAWRKRSRAPSQA